MQQEVTFPLISTTNFKKTKPLLVAVFFISWFSILLFFIPWYFALILAIGSIWIPRLISKLSRTITRIGILTLGTENIKFIYLDSSTITFEIKEIEDFKIERGATHHYAEISTPHGTQRDLYPPESHDNWISFTHNGKSYKHEFSIMDEHINARFEVIILELRRKYPDFYYASI